MTKINRRIFLASFLFFVFFFSFFQSSQAGFFDWFKWLRKNDSQNTTRVVPSAEQNTYYSLSISKSGSGIVISDDGKINCGNKCEAFYPANSKIVLKAEAGNNYKLERWNGCDKVSDGQCQTTLNKSKMIVAKFVSTRAISSQKSSSISAIKTSSNNSSNSSNSSKAFSYKSSSSSKSSSFVAKSSSISANSAATNINILVVLLNFQDSPTVPFSKDQANSLIFKSQIQEFYKEQSYGKAILKGDILGWHTLSREGDPGGTCTYPTVGEVEIQDLIANNGVDPANYRHLVLVYNHPCMMSPSGSGAGIQQLQIKGVSYQLSQIGVNARNYLRSKNFPFSWTDFDYVFSHELGHGLGLNHAELWECGAGVTFGGDDCKAVGYGNNFDLMGHSIYSLHFNAIIKDGLGWFDSSSLLTIVSSGRYTLFPYEGNSGFRAAKIKVPGREEHPFYLEYRQPLGFDVGINNSTAVSNTEGLLVNWKSGVDKVIAVKTSEYISNLLDFSPKFGGSSNDTALKVGQSFFVQDSGITIGPVISADSSGITFDVKLENVPCARHLPNEPSFSWSIKSGETVFLSTDIYNEDGFTCNQSDFEYSLIAPQGWSTKINLTNRFTLAPGASHRPGYLITAPSNIAKGSYPVEINITNLTTGASGKFTTLNLIVQ